MLPSRRWFAGQLGNGTPTERLTPVALAAPAP
jgi:hypothetical protein